MDFKDRFFTGILGIVLLSLIPLSSLQAQAPAEGPTPTGLTEINYGETNVYWVQTSFHADATTLNWTNPEVNSTISQYANFPLKLLSIGVNLYRYLFVGRLQSNSVMDTCERLALQQMAFDFPQGRSGMPNFRIYADKGTYLDDYTVIIWLNAKSSAASPHKLSCTISGTY